MATKALGDDPIQASDYHITYPINNATGTIYKSELRELADTGGTKVSGRTPTNSGNHSIRASKTISEEALRQYLEAKSSPLGNYVSQLQKSDYWSTIIGICTIEEYSCSVNPYGTNNLWGLMKNGRIISYPTMEAGIEAIEAFLAKAETNGRTTIESFRGWYCASACTNWESTVIKTKEIVENLPN